jgi:Domain of unknown function (DUF1906)
MSVRHAVAVAALVTAALAGCGSGADRATTTTTSGLTDPAEPPPAIAWGLDSNGVQSTASLDAAKAQYGADPDFMGRYLTTGGGPAVLTPSELDLLRARKIALVLVADVYARCTSDPGLGLSEPGMGRREADLAAAAAQALGVPDDGSVVIFQDIERKRRATAICLGAYADQLTSHGYRPGWYGNPNLGDFDRAFCGVARTDPRIARAPVWSSQPVRLPGGPTEAPLFMPTRPSCGAGRTVLWQYHRDQLIGGVGYDVNELHPPDARGVLWRP